MSLSSDQAAQKAHSGRFLVRYWGVRGSVPVPGPSTLRYGGNTTCVEVRCDDQVIIIDMGTGARLLGEALAEEFAGRSLSAAILFSHMHADHCSGFPFFGPAFDPSARLSIYGDDAKSVTTEEVLRTIVSFPLFPVDYDDLGASITYHGVRPGDAFQIGPARVRTCALNHPGRALGFCIEHRGRRYAHASDLEHDEESTDASLAALCEGADLLTYDAMYVEGEEYERFRGWGHSTWQAAVRLANAAGVGRLVAIHHAPQHGDDFMDQIARDLAAARPGSLVAMEGMSYDLLRGEVAAAAKHTS